MNLTTDNLFDALKIRFTDQAELLYRLTTIDLRVFTGYITLQLALGAWIATNGASISGPFVKTGLLLIDLVLSAVATALLYNNFMRRKEVVATLGNCNLALGYETENLYVDNIRLNAHTKFRPWAGWYFAGIWVATLGVAIVLFFGQMNAS